MSYNESHPAWCANCGMEACYGGAIFRGDYWCSYCIEQAQREEREEALGEGLEEALAELVAWARYWFYCRHCEGFCRHMNSPHGYALKF